MDTNNNESYAIHSHRSLLNSTQPLLLNSKRFASFNNRSVYKIIEKMVESITYIRKHIQYSQFCLVLGSIAEIPIVQVKSELVRIFIIADRTRTMPIQIIESKFVFL